MAPRRRQHRTAGWRHIRWHPVHKGYPVAYPELLCPGGRLLAEQQAHVYAGADDLMIARPATEHLAGAAAEVKNGGARRHSQRPSQRGVLFQGKGLWIRCSLSLMVKMRGISIMRFSRLRAIRPGSDPARVAISAVVRLRANVIQTGRVDPVRLAVHRLNQLFGFELFEDRKGLQSLSNSPSRV